MKLRNRFLMIVVGTFLIPFVLVIFTMLIVAPEFVYLGKNMHSGAREFFDHIAASESLEEVEALAAGMPESFFILVLDEQNSVLFRKDERGMNRLFIDEATQQLIISRKVTFTDGNTYTVVSGTGEVPRFQSYIDLIMFGSLLVFLSLISFVTIRSINRSIRELENGTRRIAEGDFDTPMLFKGDDTFESLAESIDSMRKKVKEEYDRRTRFFMGVSHDLKTPLSSIVGYSQALADGLAQTPEQQQKYLEIINSKGQLLDRRIAQLIQYIKLTNSDFQFNLKRQQLVPFLEDFGQLQVDEAALLGTEFDYEISIDRKTVITFDQDLLNRALENLLQNSYRYGSRDKPVHMICQYQKGDIVLSFANHHDRPIDSEVITHMFEPFYRGDVSRRGDGFGLGLASVKSIAESHGWKVSVRSLEREGITVFEIVIPKEQILDHNELGGTYSSQM
jgi:signal transduction histidine kinase